MRYAIGIDVGGTTIKAALIGENARIYDSISMDTPHSTGAITSACSTLVTTLRDRVNAGDIEGPEGPIHPDELISTIGVDVPGIVDEQRGIAEFSANLGWENWRAHADFEAALGTSVAFGHDVRNGAKAESHWGIALPNFFYIAIGTGIASVLVINGAPVAPHGWAGEIGQVPVPDPQRQGSLLPLEQVSSASAIAKRAIEADLVGEDAGAAEVYLLAGAGNEDAQDIINDAICALAHGIAPALAAFGPIPVVLGGGLANEGDPLCDHLEMELSLALGIIPPPPVMTATLGSRSQVLGAALSAFQCHDLLGQ